MSYAQCESQLSDMGRACNFDLTRQRIKEYRLAAATEASEVAKKKIEIAQIQAKAETGRLLEKTFQYCDQMRMLAGSVDVQKEQKRMAVSCAQQEAKRQRRN